MVTLDYLYLVTKRAQHPNARHGAAQASHSVRPRRRAFRQLALVVYGRLYRVDGGTVST